MKELLVQYARYNMWANTLIINKMPIGSPACEQHIVSSFPSLHKTITHIWSAESMWLQRLQHTERTVWQEDVFTGSLAEACGLWTCASAQLIEFAARLTDEAAVAPLAYHDRRGNPYTNPVYQVMHHIFNHSTYHRGQLITMLRQLDVQDLPSTDFISFVRLG